MEELCIKYPALRVPEQLVISNNWLLKEGWRLKDGMKDELYKDFKVNISCIGLEPAEYETVIKWFCDTMEY